MTSQQIRLGKLDAHVVRPADESIVPDRALVLCHGFGAPGDDLLPLAGALLQAFPLLKEEAVFIFPARGGR